VNLSPTDSLLSSTERLVQQQRIDNVVVQNRTLKEQVKNSAAPPQSNQQVSHNTTEHSNSSKNGKKPREPIPPSEKKLRKNIKRFTYVDCSFLNAEMYQAVFEGEEGEGEQAVLYRSLAEVFGNANNLMSFLPPLSLILSCTHRVFAEQPTSFIRSTTSRSTTPYLLTRCIDLSPPCYYSV